MAALCGFEGGASALSPVCSLPECPTNCPLFLLQLLLSRVIFLPTIGFGLFSAPLVCAWSVFTSHYHSSFRDGGFGTPTSFPLGTLRGTAVSSNVLVVLLGCRLSPPTWGVVPSRGGRVSVSVGFICIRYLLNVLYVTLNLLSPSYNLYVQITGGKWGWGTPPSRSVLVYWETWGLSGRAVGRPLESRLGNHRRPHPSRVLWLLLLFCIICTNCHDVSFSDACVPPPVLGGREPVPTIGGLRFLLPRVLASRWSS